MANQPKNKGMEVEDVKTKAKTKNKLQLKP